MADNIFDKQRILPTEASASDENMCGSIPDEDTVSSDEVENVAVPNTQTNSQISIAVSLNST